MISFINKNKNLFKNFNKRQIFFILFVLYLLFFGVVFPQLTEEIERTKNKAEIVKNTTSYILIFFIGVGIGIILLGSIFFFITWFRTGKIPLVSFIVVFILGSIIIFASLGVREWIGLHSIYFPAFVFLIVLSSGGFYFLAHWAADKGNITIARVAVDLWVLVIFVGVFLVEFWAFLQYLHVEIPLEKCRGDISPSEIRRFAMCVITGYEVPPNSPEWVLYSSILFGFVFPFIMLFSITYGLFKSADLASIVGGGSVGRVIQSVVAFIVALYGSRQFIGPFLIDILAYGMWGIFGLLIAYFLAFFVRRIGYQLYKKLEYVKQKTEVTFRALDRMQLVKIEEEIEKIKTTIPSLVREGKKTELESYRQHVQDLISLVRAKKEAAENMKDREMKTVLETYEKFLTSLDEELKKLIQEVEKKKRQSTSTGQPSYYV